MKEHTPFVAYYRLSKEGASQKDHSSLGLDAQRQIVEHYYGKPEKEFVEIKSAKNITERPELRQAIDYCKQHGTLLVVAKIDRLSRNVDDGRYVLLQLGDKLRSCDIPGNIDKFSLTMYLAFAERERELISLRTSQALQAKLKKEGPWQKQTPQWMSGEIAARGRATNTRNALENKNNIRAASVIKKMLAEGNTLVGIAKHLNSNSYETPKGKLFTHRTVKRIAEKFVSDKDVLVTA